MLTLILRSIGFTATLFALWQSSVYIDSLFTYRTPLYYTVQWWLSIFWSPVIGIALSVSTTRHK